MYLFKNAQIDFKKKWFNQVSIRRPENNNNNNGDSNNKNDVNDVADTKKRKEKKKTDKLKIALFSS